MERKRTLTMNWDGLGDNDDDDERFFESFERLSSAVRLDLASSGSDDDEFDDPRSSFTSTISSVSTTEFRNYAAAQITPDYDVWMAGPVSIQERRQRLLQGIGLSADKELLRIASKDLNRALSKKTATSSQSNNSNDDNNQTSNGDNGKPEPSSPVSTSPSPIPVMLVRSRSDSVLQSFSMDKKIKDDLLGDVSKQHLTRTSSSIMVSQTRICSYKDSVAVSYKGAKDGHSGAHTNALTSILSENKFGAFFLIKNLDTGKEFVVNEYEQDGTWNKVSDLQTGKKLTMEEFEKSVGHSPVVKELMRRESVTRIDDGGNGNDKKLTNDSYLSKSLRISKRHGAALLKNIKGVAHSMSMGGLRGGESNKERENPSSQTKNSSGSEWIKVRQTGKSCKELSALHMCQEIQAHKGSVWTIKFSSDSRYLASGGEDQTIHVWEVQECEVMSLNEGSFTPLHPSMSQSPSLGEVTPLPSEKKKKKKGSSSSSSRKGNLIPEYVHVPETVFSLSEKPVCSFTGHSGDVLDLSWSRSQLLLSSSMDKTVRLWDMETKSCLKMFAHNDFVTCIQFNPIDDNYFISGSLDEKVRIWSIPDRQLVDWTDLHEMITAVCYTPDGQGAIIGSNKGNCHMYSAEDSKLTQEYSIDVQIKKQQRKKITGFQFSTGDPSEVLVTSAGSRIRILDGSDVVYKFRGFRNVNSQISASFSLDGKYVISASEDSHVYVWKLEENRGKKGKNTITSRSHESFPCKDVSVAVPWTGTIRGDPPPIPIQSKRNSKRSNASQPSSSCNSPTKEDSVATSKRHSSPLANGREDACENIRTSPAKEDNSVAANIKRQLPPLPKKNYHAADKGSAPADDDPSQISQPDSIASSFTSNSSSARYDDPSSISNTSTPSSSWSWSWFDGNNQGSNSGQATAWGLVIVTATLGGEIRAYQNFGVPRRIGRQTNLF